MLEGGISALAWGPLGYQVRRGLAGSWTGHAAMLCMLLATRAACGIAVGKHSRLVLVQHAAGAQQCKESCYQCCPEVP
jgi:hypothetical protein